MVGRGSGNHPSQVPPRYALVVGALNYTTRNEPNTNVKTRNPMVIFETTPGHGRYGAIE
jgi:hypothetical protein